MHSIMRVGKKITLLYLVCVGIALLTIGVYAVCHYGGAIPYQAWRQSCQEFYTFNMNLAERDEPAKRKLVEYALDSVYPLANATDRLAHSPLLVYNRVPKCGSRSVMGMLQLLAKKNHFHIISAHNYTRWRLIDQEQSYLIERIMKMRSPLLYERHVYFLNFTRFGHRQPPHINVIRDPLDRMVSSYYFIRFQPGHIRNMDEKKRNRTFDQCVEHRISECLGTASWFKIIPFFCGHSLLCRNPGPASLALAKDNVEKHYALVGITEDLPGFMLAAEYLIPQYFFNASNTFKAKEREFIEKFHTSKKPAPRHSTVQFMKEKMSIEYEFYYYIKQRFYTLMHTIHQRKYKGKF